MSDHGRFTLGKPAIGGDKVTSDRRARTPLQRQLLHPLLLVLGVGFLLASITNAVLAVRNARAVEGLRLKQLSSSLLKASFPLTANVLRQLEELTSARFLHEKLGSADRVPMYRSEDLTTEMINAVEHVWPRDTTLESKTITDSIPPVRFKSVEDGARTLLSAAIPFPESARGDPASRLVILMPSESWRTLWLRTALPPLAAGALAGLVSLLIVAWLSRRFTDPLLEVATRTTAIAQGELIPLTVPERDDEVRDLILAINLMVRELGQLHQSIRHGEQLRTLGQLGAGFAHQLRNAALGARMALEFSDRDTTGGRDEESLRIAMAQLQRMELYLDRFLKLSQPRGLGEQAAVSGYVATERQSIRLDGLVESVLQLIEPMARHAHVAISQEPSPAMETELSGDVVALEQMLSNLVVNALEAAASGIGRPDAENAPRLSPAVIVKASAKATRISIEVWDTGAGPPEGVAQTLFQPFVTTRPEGCGLGLTVAREIAVAHGGDITWRREKANGAAPWTVFQVTLAK
ncbi:MAG: hypothetical protein C0478_02490 [Planctomyces sp.]|nr:hypothetical protein [Planctomyces sp.]